MKETIYKYCLSILVFMLAILPIACITIPSVTYAKPAHHIVSLDAGKVGAEDLSGMWDFLPMPEGGLSLDAAEKQAAEIYAASINQNAAAEDWPSIRVPQFLNRTVWWLAHISRAYEQQETERVAAFPFDAEATSAGWYRKTFEMPKVPAGQASPEVRIIFEGVAMVSRVYCNGQPVGTNVGMFGEFTCRLTPHLKPGKNNQLLVYVERGQHTAGGTEVVDVAVTVPVTKDMLTSLNCGMFGGFGRGPRAKFMGIWQPVTLEVSQPGGEIEDVFFNPRLDGHDLQITLLNPTDVEAVGRVSYDIHDAKSGDLLTGHRVESTIRLEAGEQRVLNFNKDQLSPTHWLPDAPHLYHLVVKWTDDQDRLVDQKSHDVGYRTVSIRGAQVYLNGKPYWSRGANMPPYGYKPNDEVTARAFLEYMRDGNTPITRTHGNPFNRMWFNLCDEIGIGVCVEGVRPWALMSKQPAPPLALLEHWKTEQLQSVRQYRNHPSILFYCVSNEGLQGDHDNPEKLALFADIIAAMREIDPSRPIFQTSGDPDHTGNADMESIHAYWGWYESSSYINDYTEPRRGLSNSDDRPFINMECAVPYQVLDDGAVHPTYKMHYSAHPWIGELGVHGDPAYFSEHVRAEAKMKAEKLRYQRDGQMNAGVMLFSNVTWIGRMLSRPPEEWQPFPVYHAVQQAFEPVLIAMESPQRVFTSGDTVETTAHVVNDDASFRNYEGLKLRVSYVSEKYAISEDAATMPLGDVSYFDVESFALSLTIPILAKSQIDPIEAILKLELLDVESQVVSVNTYPIRVAPDGWSANGLPGTRIATAGCSEDMQSFLISAGAAAIPLQQASERAADVVLLGPEADDVDLDTALSAVKDGGRILVLQQGHTASRFIDDHLLAEALDDQADVALVGEFVEMIGWTDHPGIFRGLDAMDWKWWSRGGGKLAYVASAGHRIKPNAAGVTILGRYLAPHFYWAGDRDAVYQSSLRYPVFAVEQDRAVQLVVCDLVITDALGFDPRAGRTLTNLLTESIANQP